MFFADDNKVINFNLSSPILIENIKIGDDNFK